MASSTPQETKTTHALTVVGTITEPNGVRAQHTNTHNSLHQYTVKLQASYADQETMVYPPSVQTSIGRKQNEMGVWINTVTIDIDPYIVAEYVVLEGKTSTPATPSPSVGEFPSASTSS